MVRYPRWLAFRINVASWRNGIALAVRVSLMPQLPKESVITRIQELKEDKKRRLTNDKKKRDEIFDGDNFEIRSPKQRKEARELKAKEARKKAIQVYC